MRQLAPARVSGWGRLVAAALVVAHAAAALPAVAQDTPPPAGTTPPPAGTGPQPSPPGSPDTTQAPSDADAARRAEARARFTRGLELVQSEEWDAALAEFLASRELFPTQVAIKNAAISLRQLRRLAEALDMYEELVRGFGDKLQPDDRRAVDKALVDLGNQVAEVTVLGNSAGAVVVIDGKQRGTLPLARPLRVDTGTRRVRVFKEGFLPFETELTLAGAQKREVRADLVALAQSGRLRVEEVSGQDVEVVVDGVVVGKAPWTGVLSLGGHTVVLRGAGDLGSAPVPAAVRANDTTTLRIAARALDAVLRIEPRPENARVDLDGVQLGNGVWEGKLPSGAHRVEVTADGFLPVRRDVVLRPRQPEVLRLALERDLSSPRWSSFRPHFYAELVGGLGITPSFGGGMDGACGSGDCSDESHSIGFLAGARGGFQITPGLGVELFLGYMRASASAVRLKTGRADVPVSAEDYRDETTLGGPLVAASMSYSFLETTPLTGRLWGGAMRGSASFSNEGTFSGVLTDAQSGDTYRFSERVSVDEADENIWVPFVAPELRFGYRISRSFSVDLGLAAFIMFAPATPRTGSSSRDQSQGSRSTQLSTVPSAFPNGNSANPGLMRLDNDDGFGTFVTLVPSLAARVDF